MDALDEERTVANVVTAQQRLHKVVEERVKKNRERQSQAASRGKLPNFAVGDYLMVVRVQRPGSTLKLMSTWAGRSLANYNGRLGARVRRPECRHM